MIAITRILLLTAVCSAMLPVSGTSAAELEASPPRDSTAARLKTLQENIDSFQLALAYVGPEDKPYYRLYLQVAPLPPLKTSPFRRHVRVTTDEARQLVDRMARTGMLDDMRGGEAKIAGGPLYVLRLATGNHAMYQNLGFGADMRDRLKTLRTLLTGEARSQMDLLLGRLGISPQEVRAHATVVESKLVSWGPPVDGIRVGLAPGAITLDKQDRHVEVTVWYENVGEEPRKVVDHADLNVTTLVFAGESNGKTFRTNCVIPRLATTPLKFRELKPGERFQEKVALYPGGSTNYAGVPQIEVGGSISLQVGWCRKADPHTEQDWSDPTTRKSGLSRINRIDTVSQTSVAELIRRLHADDGHQRVIATRELFARGKTITAELRTAGAKQVVTEGTISSTRLDAVYSLLVGFPPGNYDQRSFGLTIDKKAPTERVQLLIRKYGTHQPPGSRLNRDGHPTAYIRIAGEWNVETALRHVLQEDAEVKTVNLNYIEQ